MNFKTISLNIWHGERMSDALDYLESADAEVVLLQEVTSGNQIKTTKEGIGNVAEILQAHFPHHHLVYAPVWLLPDYGISQGQAILSRYPISHFSAEFYSESITHMNKEFWGKTHGGLLLRGDIQLNENLVITCMTTHFPWSLYPEITEIQKQAVLNLLAKLETYDECILGGDFNITSDTSIYDLLSQSLIDDRPDNTSNTLHPQIHKIQGKHQLAVDYLFHKGSRIQRLNSQVPLVPASDHLPVVVEYNIKE